MKDEIWRDIEGFEGIYQVSNLGRIKSLNRTVNCNSGERLVTGKIMSVVDRGNGYAFVSLCKEGKQYNHLVHRLVAKAFIPNPHNYPEVNHIDENKMNPKVENLEWCTRSYNCKYNDRANRVAEKKRIPIIQMDKNGNVISGYESISDASIKTNISIGNIHSCLIGKRKTASGYLWKEKEND